MTAELTPGLPQLPDVFEYSDGNPETDQNRWKQRLVLGQFASTGKFFIGYELRGNLSIPIASYLENAESRYINRMEERERQMLRYRLEMIKFNEGLTTEIIENLLGIKFNNQGYKEKYNLRHSGGAIGSIGYNETLSLEHGFYEELDRQEVVKAFSLFGVNIWPIKIKRLDSINSQISWI